MENTSAVRLHAFVTINCEDWEVFKQMVVDVKAIVQSEGEKVLTHETYYQPDSFDCLIIEAYINEQAFLDHLELIKPLSEKYKVDWTVNRIELCGPYSSDTVNAMKGANKENPVVFYNMKVN